jgi:hypothetical protein
MDAIDYSIKNAVPWIHWDRQEWFFNDSNPPWRSKATLRKCEEILATWGQLVWCPCHRGAWRTEVDNWPWYYFLYPITKKDRQQDPYYKNNDKFELKINPTRYQDRAAIPLAIPFPDKISAMKFAQQHMDMKAEPINYTDWTLDELKADNQIWKPVPLIYTDHPYDWKKAPHHIGRNDGG